jgi:hypothetical protein
MLKLRTRTLDHVGWRTDWAAGASTREAAPATASVSVQQPARPGHDGRPDREHSAVLFLVLARAHLLMYIADSIAIAVLHLALDGD